jgi:hypothetical protein
MLIKNVGSTDPAFHVTSGIGKALIASGVAVEVLPTAAPKQTGTLEWTASRGPSVADTELPPAIFFSACPACRSEAGYMKGPTVHLTGRVFHCGQFETVPTHVAEHYVQLYKKFKHRQARRD